MTTSVTMPQLGESVVEGTIAKWLVAEGDAVQEDQALVEITTDKIDTEIPSPVAGVVGTIAAREGETVGVGTVICTIEPAARAAAASRGEKPATAPASREAKAAPASRTGVPETPRTGVPGTPRTQPAPAVAAPAREPEPAAAAPAAAGKRSALTRTGVALDEDRVRSARARRGRSPAPVGGDGGDGNGGAPGAPARMTPVVRRMVAEHGVDLSRIRGSGVGGRITKQDLLDHLRGAGVAAPEPAAGYGDLLGVEGPAPDPSARARRPAAASLREAGPAPRASAPAGGAARPGPALSEYAPPAVEPGEGDRVEPFSKRRKIIAEHMVYSKAVSPHVYTMAEIDMSRVAALREANKRRLRESDGVALTYLHFVIAAACRALRDVPRLNAVVGSDALILRRDVNIGIAVETEQGLVVPVIRNADRLSLRGLAHAAEKIATKARDRRLRLEDLQGGTFTISNPGREGNLIGFAVINQPQLGILRMGEIKKRPVVIEVDGADVIAIRPIMLLSLSYDHRVIDGATGNSFLFSVKEHLERAEFEL